MLGRNLFGPPTHTRNTNWRNITEGKKGGPERIKISLWFPTPTGQCSLTGLLITNVCHWLWGLELPLHKDLTGSLPQSREHLGSCHYHCIHFTFAETERFKRVTRKRYKQDQYPDFLTKPSEEPSALNLTSRINILVVTQVHKGVSRLDHLIVYLMASPKST